MADTPNTPEEIETRAILFSCEGRNPSPDLVSGRYGWRWTPAFAGARHFSIGRGV